MKKTEYTHIRVSKELHAILKSEAEARGMSIANYITKLQSSIQSIRDLVSSDGDVNIDNIAQSTKTPSKTLNLKNLNSPERIRTSVTGSKGQYA
jgi:predicted DNA-binding ribbon-helix-helix protein